MYNLSFEELLDKYLTGSMTEQERQVFNKMLAEPEHQDKLKMIIDAELNEHAFEGEPDDQKLALIQSHLLRKIQTRQVKAKPVLLYIKRVAVAAVLLLMLGTAGWWLVSSRKGLEIKLAEKEPETIIPGGNRAVLKLSDGTEILLDNAGKGTLAQQGDAKVIKLNDGQLSYQSSKKTTTENLYNSITTPKGGQYQLVLADGSKVWLNASSSLRFPVVFSGTKRVVELTGEGYFEVAKNERMPFHVQANAVDVKVVGTHFNINAYSDEGATRTTLLEGSVSVSLNEQTRTLRPGQQAAANNTGMVVLNDVDIDEVVAWKNGMFQFKSADIGTILRQAERWYDVHFVYEGEIKERFSGQISRNVNADQLLKILELTDKVNFEVKGRTIVVKP